ncbi:MAG: HDOD domain-containing protein [bacterium]
MSITASDLISKDSKVPSLPTIFLQINEAVNKPRSTMRDIARIISADQGLSARLLRIVNSAFYGFPSKIDTISRAITIIGTKQLRDLALATTVIQMFRGMPTKLVNINSFWRHSVACGISSRILASYHSESNIEHFFVAGLLHDIGRLLIYKEAPSQAKDVLAQSRKKNELLHLVERDVLGFDHAEVGGLLLKAWRLPASLEEAVRFHHRPARAPRFPMEASMTHLADLIANALQMGSSGERFVPHLEGEAWNRLGISTSVLRPAVQQIDRQFENTVALFLEDNGS